MGNYQVAAEVPGSLIVPFYGRQEYRPFTHYWLKFYTTRADGPAQPSVPATLPKQSQPVRGGSGAFEDQARSLGIDPSTVDSFFIDVSTETQIVIALVSNGVVKVFEYATNRPISETSASGEIRDLIRGETLKPTDKANVYGVYINGRFVRTTRFEEDGIETSSRSAADKSTARRYLKQN